MGEKKNIDRRLKMKKQIFDDQLPTSAPSPDECGDETSRGVKYIAQQCLHNLTTVCQIRKHVDILFYSPFKVLVQQFMKNDSIHRWNKLHVWEVLDSFISNQWNH